MEKSRVILVGGVGHMLRHYRTLAETRGYELTYHERSSPQVSVLARPVVVLVFTMVCSHPQREAAQRLAKAAECPIVFLRTASKSSLRDALDALLVSDMVCSA